MFRSRCASQLRCPRKRKPLSPLSRASLLDEVQRTKRSAKAPTIRKTNPTGVERKSRPSAKACLKNRSTKVRKTNRLARIPGAKFSPGPRRISGGDASHGYDGDSKPRRYYDGGSHSPGDVRGNG